MRSLAEAARIVNHQLLVGHESSHAAAAVVLAWR